MLLAGVARATRLLWYDAFTDTDRGLNLHAPDIGGALYAGGLCSVMKVNGLCYMNNDTGFADVAYTPALGVWNQVEVLGVLRRGASFANNQFAITGRNAGFSQMIGFGFNCLSATTVKLELTQTGVSTVTLVASYPMSASDAFRFRMVFVGSTVACYIASADGSNEVQAGTTQTLATPWNDSGHQQAGFSGRWKLGNSIDDFLVRQSVLHAGAAVVDLVSPDVMSGTLATGEWFTITGEAGAPRHVPTAGPYAVAGPYGFGYLVRGVAFSRVLTSEIPHDTVVQFATDEPVAAQGGALVYSSPAAVAKVQAARQYALRFGLGGMGRWQRVAVVHGATTRVDVSDVNYFALYALLVKAQPVKQRTDTF